MRKHTKRGAVAVVSVALVLAASGCSTKASDNEQSSQDGPRKRVWVQNVAVRSAVLESQLDAIESYISSDISPEIDKFVIAPFADSR